MRITTFPSVLFLAAAVLAAPARSQDMLGIAINGDVYEVDSASGTYALLGSSGFNLTNCMAKDPAGEIYTVTTSLTSLFPSRLVRIDPATGAGTSVVTCSPINVSAAAFDDQGTLFLVVYNASSTMDLMTLDPGSGALALVAPLPAAAQPIQSLAFSGNFLYAVSNTDSFCTNAYGLGLVRINPVTGALSDVSGALDAACNDVQGLCAGSGGTLTGAGKRLWAVDIVSGVISASGPVNGTDLRGVEFLGAAGGFQLTVTGSVPGQVTLDFSGATAGGTVAVVYGPGGVFTYNGSPCTGLMLDVNPPTLAVLMHADAAGMASLTVNAPPSAAGKTVQGVDVASCTTSNPVVL
ncbi:MAG: hypothetical protein EYC70_12600 [Planctomycetota bacterium]|nr:MAG: hypothetical protein EYC70_12600 [Planctomycetota bacterium]